MRLMIKHISQEMCFKLYSLFSLLPLIQLFVHVLFCIKNKRHYFSEQEFNPISLNKYEFQKSRDTLFPELIRHYFGCDEC